MPQVQTFQCVEFGSVIVLFDLSLGAMFMSVNATFSVNAQLCPVEGSTVLSPLLFEKSCSLELMNTVCKLALSTVGASSFLGPFLTNSRLVKPQGILLNLDSQTIDGLRCEGGRSAQSSEGKRRV